MATKSNISPPAISFPFVDANRCLTPSAVQLLQPLIGVVNGLGITIADEVLLTPPVSPQARAGSSPVQWIPTLGGDGTAGTATYTTQVGFQVDIGPLRVALFSLAVSALGGPSGNAVIGGFPIPSNTASGFLQAGWVSTYGGITLSGGRTQLGIQLAPGAVVANLVQSGSGLSSAKVGTGGLSNATLINGGIAFFR